MAVPAWDALQQDVRYACRSLLKARAFSLTAVATLALAIGGTVAVFSVVDAVYWSALPYAHAEQLVMIENANVCAEGSCFADIGDKVIAPGFPMAEQLEAWPPNLPMISGAAGLAIQEGKMSTPLGLISVGYAAVSGGFFSVLGLRPLLGRTFVPPDDRPG